MKSLVKKFISYFLLLLFITAITPDVFIHAFAHHEDSVDVYSSSSSFSEHHIHCDHLLDEMPAAQLSNAVQLPPVPIHSFELQFHSPESYHSVISAFVSLRGPPSVA